MKKLTLLTVVVSLALAIAGCNLLQQNGTSSKINLDFTTNDIESIDVFTGSVPARAKKKTVTSEDDIKIIIAGLKALTIERDATGDDIPAGGIGMQFMFNLSDGGSYVIKCNSNLLVTADGFYKVKGDSMDTDKFWKSLDYDEIDVTESELPKIE